MTEDNERIVVAKIIDIAAVCENIFNEIKTVSWLLLFLLVSQCWVR